MKNVIDKIEKEKKNKAKRNGKKLAIIIVLVLLLASVCIFGILRLSKGRKTFEGESEPALFLAKPAYPDYLSGLSIPAYSGYSFAAINNNVPFFETEAESGSIQAWEYYGELDSLGRCTFAEACLGPELIPDTPREDISVIRPSGWHNEKYDFIDGGFLYNRCHLIAHMLTGQNANEKNLITGTRYMNVEGMLLIEFVVDDYIMDTGNHVRYRVTPVFEGDNLVASGVLMEARSIEDNGRGISYCVYCYNIQPGVEIDYSTGKNRENKNQQQSK